MRIQTRSETRYQERKRKRETDDTNARPGRGNSSLPRAGIPSRCLFRENDWTRFRVSCPPLFRPLATPARFCPLESRQLSPETRPISIFAVGDMSLPFPPTFSRSITEIPGLPLVHEALPTKRPRFQTPDRIIPSRTDATQCRFRISCIFYVHTFLHFSSSNIFARNTESYLHSCSKIASLFLFLMTTFHCSYTRLYYLK